MLFAHAFGGVFNVSMPDYAKGKVTVRKYRKDKQTYLDGTERNIEHAKVNPYRIILPNAVPAIAYWHNVAYVAQTVTPIKQDTYTHLAVFPRDIMWEFEGYKMPFDLHGWFQTRQEVYFSPIENFEGFDVFANTTTIKYYANTDLKDSFYLRMRIAFFNEELISSGKKIYKTTLKLQQIP